MPKLSKKRTKSRKSLSGGTKRTKSRKSLSGGTKRTKSRKSLSGGTKRTKSRKSLSGGVIGSVKPETFNYEDLYEEVSKLLANNGELNKLISVKLTYDQKQQINHLDITDFTVGAPLHIAAGINNLELVNKLLENGAEIDLADASYRTPLFIACLKGHFEVAELLLKKGANKDLADEEGTTPFAIAKKRRHPNIMNLLKKPRFPRLSSLSSLFKRSKLQEQERLI